jgi:hypothetical protein
MTATFTGKVFNASRRVTGAGIPTWLAMSSKGWKTQSENKHENYY